MLEVLLRDLRHSLRMLLAQPGFALSAILTLALGIGANTAVFSAIEGRLLRPLPYPQSERLVHIYNTSPKLGVVDEGVTVPDYLDRREHAPALADSAIYYDYSFDLVGQGAPQRIAGVGATPSLFTTLGVEAQVGRIFVEAEAQGGNEHVVLLSDGLWRSAFAADPAIVGRDLRISGQSYRVIGVMPKTFAFPRREVGLWVPFVFTPKQASDAMRGFEFARSVGRLAPGATIAQLDAQFDAIVARNVERLGGAGAVGGADFRERVERSGFTGRARSLQSQLIGNMAPSLWLLQATVGFVLLIACANVANLSLIRLSSRQRELGVRAALGAGRGRIARQLLVESAVLATAGGVVGIGVALAGMAVMRRLALDGGDLGFSIGLQLPVLGIALVSVLVCGLVAGLVPLLALWRSAGWNLANDGARGSVGSRRFRLQRDALVVAQLALAATLLVGAGLLMHSFWRLQRQDPGFNSAGVVSVSVNLSRDRYRDVADTRRFQERLMTAVRALPGVESAGVASGMPLSEDYGSSEFVVEGVGAEAGATVGNYRIVDEEFFRAMQIPLLRGRGFAASDDAEATAVAIIDEALALQAFGARDPLGRRIATRGVDGALHWRTIVGVIGNVKHTSLAEDGDSPTFFASFAQEPTRIFRVAIRSALVPEALTPLLRDALARIDPEQPIWDVMGMQERVSRSLDGQRTTMLLLVLFAAVALGVCAVGIYGVLAYAVAQRTGEIGVRMSLGANRRDVLWLVFRDAIRLVVVGLSLGIALAFALGRQLRAQLFGVEVLDPLTLTFVLATIATVAFAASWIPARRAAGMSPVQALRCAG